MKRLVFGFLAVSAVVFAQDADLASRAVGVMEQRCFGCHGASAAQGGLRLNTREAALQGGTRGPAIVAGNAAGSRVVQAIRRTGELSMPPGPKLPEADIATIEKWIAGGAAWPQTVPANAAGQTWWSFQKPVRPAVPVLKDAWVRNPIDAFIAKKLGEEKLKPAREADRRTLIRRAYLDLHGLPPTAEQIGKFVNDAAPDAYEKLIDELLASPRYGEKWGRHWLDLARYGDTSGFEQDPYLLYAWRYRDYVIDSFNNDKPYDRFVKEQIGGDELYPDDPASMAGTGFYTVGPNRDMLYKVEDINRVETLIDWVDTTGSVFLGLSVGCARCHDHKFDPIPQRDYYALQAIFQPAEKTRVFLQYDPARGYDLAEVSRQVRLYEISDQLSAILPAGPGPGGAGAAGAAADVAKAAGADAAKTQAAVPVATTAPRGGRGGGISVKPEDEPKLRALEQQLVQMFRNYKPGPFAPGIHDVGRETPTRSWLPGRGGHPPDAVAPGFLSALGGGTVPVPPPDATTSGNRKALANWIGTRENPLTARVMVNRIWQYHFGQGLMATPSDFGHRGGTASHPELLDWLATEFMDNGWSVKKLTKLIMTSSAYRQSSEVSKDAEDRDAANLYLSHFNRRRLLPEEIRDTMLQSSGVLNLKMAGRPVVPEIAKEELYGLSGNGMWVPTADTTEHTRRSIYMLSRRTFRPAMFETFDAPEGIQSCSRRVESNTAPQSLTLLNGQWTVQEARRLAEKLAGVTADDAELIRNVWLAVYAHPPKPEDVVSSQAFLERQTAELGGRKAAAGELVRVLFNTNEFLYVD
ncbi:MAG: PSD1 and planctomycete cytochrome C domain-containing protein [Acidobacteriota bacterium]